MPGQVLHIDLPAKYDKSLPSKVMIGDKNIKLSPPKARMSGVNFYSPMQMGSNEIKLPFRVKEGAYQYSGDIITYHKISIMNLHRLFFTIGMCLFALGCKSQSDVINESDKTFHSAFVVFSAGQVITHDVADLSKRISPTESQINLANEILLANLPRIVYDRIGTKNWKRQYFGYLNSEDEIIIYANFLNFKSKKQAKNYFPGWKTKFIIGYGDFFEENTFRFLINLANQEIEIY